MGTNSEPSRSRFRWRSASSAFTRRWIVILLYVFPVSGIISTWNKGLAKLTNKQSRFVEEYQIDLNATRPRRIKDRRFLPSVYALSTTGEWAKKCLEIMLPHKGCIGAFGHRISKETEEMIFAGMEWTIMYPIPAKVEAK